MAGISTCHTVIGLPTRATVSSTTIGRLWDERPTAGHDARPLPTKSYCTLTSASLHHESGDQSLSSYQITSAPTAPSFAQPGLVMRFRLCKARLARQARLQRRVLGRTLLLHRSSGQSMCGVWAAGPTEHPQGKARKRSERSIVPCSGYVRRRALRQVGMSAVSVSMHELSYA